VLGPDYDERLLSVEKARIHCVEKAMLKTIVFEPIRFVEKAMLNKIDDAQMRCLEKVMLYLGLGCSWVLIVKKQLSVAGDTQQSWPW
jgi:hypothetical protein